MTKLKAALYARVSTEEQAKEGYSIAAQISEIKKYAEQHGYEIVDEYVDEGASGKSIEGRPQMKRLLKDASQQKFGVVIIYKIDRLARKLKDALEISEILEKNNVNLISLNEKFDTTTAFGRTAFQMICSFAELERNNIVERVKLGMEQRAKEGISTEEKYWGMTVSTRILSSMKMKPLSSEKFSIMPIRGLATKQSPAA